MHLPFFFYILLWLKVGYHTEMEWQTIRIVTKHCIVFDLQLWPISISIRSSASWEHGFAPLLRLRLARLSKGILFRFHEEAIGFFCIKSTVIAISETKHGFPQEICQKKMVSCKKKTHIPYSSFQCSLSSHCSMWVYCLVIQDVWVQGAFWPMLGVQVLRKLYVSDTWVMCKLYTFCLSKMQVLCRLHVIYA